VFAHSDSRCIISKASSNEQIETNSKSKQGVSFFKKDARSMYRAVDTKSQPIEPILKFVNNYHI